MMNTTANISVCTKQATRLAVGIGGFSFGMWCAPEVTVAVDQEHTPFLLQPAGGQACSIELEIDWVPSVLSPKTQPTFSSGGLWTAYVSKTGTKFYFTSPAIGPSPYKALWLDPSCERGHVVLSRQVIPPETAIFPLEYPLDELIMMHRLAAGEGVEVHALGLADRDGSGYLFLGHSGAGKSTTARIWMEQTGVKLLSDDRIILRKHDGKFWMYGTPWHGDAGVASPDRTPLSSIFLLEQHASNQLAPIATSRAAAELFARSFVPHYMEKGIHFTLDFLDQITRSVPCSILRFTPTAGAVEAVRYARV